MRKKLNIGDKYGKLTILDIIPKYKNNKTYYECICECGNIRYGLGYELKNGKTYQCLECAEQIRRQNKRRDITGQKFGRLTVKKMLPHYKDGKTYVECQCDCGNNKNIIMYNIVNGHTSSCGCWERESRYMRKHYVDITGNRYGRLVVIKNTDQKASNGVVIWECKCDCGNTSYVSSFNLIHGITQSCGCKRGSKWEDYINDFLTKNNIEYEYQKTFPDCKNDTGTCLLFFDFFIPQKQIMIEYDGLQHFEPVPYWGGEEKFKATQRNDEIKNNYCASHNIQMIRIPYYYSKEDIYSYLINILNP